LERWVGITSGMDGDPFTNSFGQLYGAAFDLGSQQTNNVLVYGFFKNIDGVSVNSIAYYDGNGLINPLNVSNYNCTTTCNGVRIWNINNMVIADTTPGIVTSVINFSDQKIIWVAGLFDMAGNISVYNIAIYNFYFGQWFGTGAGGVNGKVNTMVYMKGRIFVGGEFLMAGNVIGTKYIASYNLKLNIWESLNSGLDGIVTKLLIYNNYIIAIGDFTNSAGVVVPQISQWDGKKWTYLNIAVTQQQQDSNICQDIKTLQCPPIFTISDIFALKDKLYMTTSIGTVYSYDGSKFLQLFGNFNVTPSFSSFGTDPNQELFLFNNLNDQSYFTSVWDPDVSNFKPVQVGSVNGIVSFVYSSSNIFTFSSSLFLILIFLYLL